jgi:hypothetical protein
LDAAASSLFGSRSRGGLVGSKMGGDGACGAIRQFVETLTPGSVSSALQFGLTPEPKPEPNTEILRRNIRNRNRKPKNRKFGSVRLNSVQFSVYS